MQQLEQTPRSIATGLGILLGLLTGVTMFAYWYQGLAHHDWWSRSYMISFAIPFAIAAVVQYIWFVPRRVAWDSEHLEIDTWLGAPFRAPWSELRHWGYASMVFTLECGSLFGGGRTFQIALKYFTPDSTDALLAFLVENCADQKANVWFGRHGVG